MLRPIPPLPVAQARSVLPPADEAVDFLRDEWRGLDERREARERPHHIGLVRQPRCPSYRKFTRKPDECEACGFYGSRGLAA